MENEIIDHLKYVILTFLKNLTYANVKDLLRALSKEQQERKVIHKAWQHSQELVEQVEKKFNTRMSYLIYHIVHDKTDIFTFSAVYGVCVCMFVRVRAFSLLKSSRKLDATRRRCLQY